MNACVSSTQVQGRQMTLEGMCTVHLLYLGEDSASLHDRIICYTKVLFIKRFCSSDYHPVISKQETSHSRNQSDKK